MVPVRPACPPARYLPLARRTRTARTGPGLRIALLTVAASLAIASWHAGAQPRAQPDGRIVYRVVPGDTLVGITDRFLEPPHRWQDLRDLNRIRDPRRLAPGTDLLIDPQWLRGEPAGLTVGEVGGSATLDGTPLTAGAVGGEGSRIETGPDGVVVLRLRDGTQLTIPPASTVRFERLRQYLGTDSIDARIDIERGAIETRSAPGRARPLRVRTPAATAAVRGTEFRVRSGGSTTAVEVLTGAVAADGPAGGAALSAGEGALAAIDRPPRVETLLPAPSLDALPARLEATAGTLRFAPVTGAAGYTVQAALDEGFTRLLAEVRGTQPEITVVTRADGPLHVRARAVSALGLEGREARAVVEVAARPEPPMPARPGERAVIFGGDVALTWTEPAGVASFRVQVAADDGFTAPWVDLVVERPGTEVSLPAVESPRTVWWRVASITGPPTRQGPFSPARRFEQRALGGAPSGEVDDDRLELAWPALAGHRYRLQLATDPTFAAPMLERDLIEPKVTIEGLAPGTYWTRTRSIDAQGVESPYGPAQRFQVRALLRSGAEAPVGTASGAPVELTDFR
jgi:hypothetical protein